MSGGEWNTSGGFGPQIRFLDALFVRAAALTPEDVEAFGEGWCSGEWPRHRIDDWAGRVEQNDHSDLGRGPRRWMAHHS